MVSIYFFYVIYLTSSFIYYVFMYLIMYCVNDTHLCEVVCGCIVPQSTLRLRSLKVVLAHLGDIRSTLREHLGNIPGTFREHSENIQNNMHYPDFSSLWECRSCACIPTAVKGTFREHSGNIRGALELNVC